MSATKVALGFALAVALGLGFVSRAHAQQADVQIAQLSCSGDPELVVIENLGDAVQTLTGWELQSDPPDSETFDLTVLGGLAPGASISIQSGPSAGGVFKWGLEFIYRDDDPTDYARIVDDTGAIVHQVNCAEATPTPSPSPTPSPEPSPPNGVPNGGGAPPIPSGSLSPALILLVGGSLAVAGLAMIALPRLRLRPALAVAASSPQRDYRGGSGTRRGRSSTALGLTLVGLCAVAVLLILRRRA
jgi:hypothetical protein